MPVSIRSAIATVARLLDRVSGALHRYSGATAAGALATQTSDLFYQTIFQSSSHAFFTVDLAANITGWNHGAERLFGFAATDVIGRPISLIVPEDRRDEITRIRATVKCGKPIEDFETVRLTHDGTLIDVVLSISPMKSPAGEPLGSLVLAHNVTDKKQVEEQFRLAVEASPAGMIMTDQAGTIIMVNGEAEHLFGYPRDELVGQSIELLVPAAQRHHHAQLRGAYDIRPEARRVSVRNLAAVRKDGKQFPVEILLNPMRTRTGLKVLSVVTDASEARRHEQLKNEFVATVSHELRTPMTSIAGSLGLLLGTAKGQLPDAMTRLLTIAHRNSQRLVRLINDVLDIEKIESGKMQFDLTRVEVRALIEQAIEAARGFADQHGSVIRLDPTSQNADVLADPDRLNQVITNLLSNAAKFTPRNGEVLVKVESRNDKVRITVRDHGPGISPAFRGRIFDKFAQDDGSNARLKGGTGLGLSIAKQIVTRLGGEIGFTDAPGGGTIFFVVLPRMQPTAAADVKPTADRTRILICDDDMQAAHAFLAQLEANGFTADITLNGREAMERASSTRYDAILLDSWLPDCDGISLILQLRAQPQSHDTPILMMSDDADFGRDLRTLGLDVLESLHKPVHADSLARSLQRVCAQRPTQRPRILHIDADPAISESVGRLFNNTAEIVSVPSVDAARRALASNRFDLAVLAIALTSGAGLELLSNLRDSTGDTIPIVLLSPHAAVSAQIATSGDVLLEQMLPAPQRRRRVQAAH
jgi:PAS domain S-box-containing protein